MSITQVVSINQNNKPKFGKNQGVWEYRTIDNEVLCYVERQRIENVKVYIPWTMQGGKWVKRWYPGYKERPLYNVHLLRLTPEKPVLLVEGEKAADAAVIEFPEFNVLSWMGGAGAAKLAEIEYLAGLVVYLFPDNDDAGYKAMRVLEERLLPIVSKLFFIDTKSLGVPTKWDIGDIDFGDVDLEDIKQLINDSRPIVLKKDTLNKRCFPDLSEKGNPLNTTDNIMHLLKHFDITVRYNLMTNYPEFRAEGKSFSTVNEADCYFTEICNLCVKNGVPKVDLDAHLNLISERNRYHPAIDFIESKKWDGISRIDDFMSTVDADNPILARKLIYRWMLGAVAAPYSSKGISLEGVLVFQGKQNVGKTYWFLKLVPEKYRYLIKSGIFLDPTNKDSVINCTSCWMGELAEIDGTIRKSDVAAQKAFITQSIDYYRVPFGRKTKTVPRQTSFYGSVNPSQYLVDETGNRRYWSISVNKIDYHHSVDMQQVWAEFKSLLDSGESYRLNEEEKILLNSENECFQSFDPLEELIINRFRWDELYRNHPMTASEVLVALGFTSMERLSNGMARKCGAILAKLTGKKARKSNSKLLFDMPGQKLMPG